MKDPNAVIYVDVSFETLTRRLFGLHRCCSAGNKDLLKWQRHLRKVVVSLKGRIERSLTGDDAYVSQLLIDCDNLIEVLEKDHSKDELVCLVMSQVFTLCFKLTGGMPENRSAKQAFPASVTQPSPFRTVAFVRTAEQRRLAILDAAYHERLPAGTLDFGQLVTLYQRECKKSDILFLKVMKTRFPDIYRMFEL
jgi:hypothetical protein